MAHGTGYYWERKYSADIQTDEYVAVFYRLRYYYHEQMSDCYEPTWEDKDEYSVTVMKWRKDRWGDLVADCISNNISIGVDKATANKIWWNLKNRNIQYKEIKKYFEELAGEELID